MNTRKILIVVAIIGLIILGASVFFGNSGSLKGSFVTNRAIIDPAFKINKSGNADNKAIIDPAFKTGAR